ncbi:MAG: AsmA family protein [Bacteroidota bacterium]|nr:AsmA family protein [Bacteroidota bacterium]
MKKTLKIFTKSVIALLLLIVVGVVITMWFVLTPKRLTPIVSNQANKLLNCEVKVETVDLTFFKTFPKLGLHVENLTLINPVKGAQSDTLAHFDDFIATIDHKEWRKNKSVVLNEIYLKNGTANVYVDSLGDTNYDIYQATEDTIEDEEKSSSELPKLIDIQKVEIENLKAHYIDEQSKTQAKVTNLNFSIRAKYQKASGNAKLNLNIDNVQYSVNDSSQMAANIDDFSFSVDGSMADNMLEGLVTTEIKSISFSTKDTAYLDSTNLRLNAPLSIDMDDESITLTKTELAINTLEFVLDGWAKRGTDSDIEMDMNLITETWGLDDIFALIPEDYQHLVSDVNFDGDIQISGRANGFYNDTSMPIINTNLRVINLNGTYADLPYTFANTNADINLDLNTNTDKADVIINNLSTILNNNALKCSGSIRDATGLQQCDLSLLAKIDLQELKSFLPDSLNVDMSGKADCNFNIKAKLDDLVKTDLTKIKSKGRIDFTDLHVLYQDSMYVESPSLSLGYQVPSPNMADNIAFNELIQTTLLSPEFNIKMIDSVNTIAKATSADLTLGLSNVMDTSVPPSMGLNFAFDKFTAEMDTINAEIIKPNGYASYYQPKADDKVSLNLSYQSDGIHAILGEYASINTEFITVLANATRDTTQENSLLEWNPNVNVNFNSGKIQLADLLYDVNIPQIKFDFTPEEFYIENSRFEIGASDFNLKGSIKNFDNYFRDEGLLTGNLDFISEEADIDQLMALVDGLGTQDSSETETPDPEMAEDTSDESDPDPFMVPKGIDITLNVNVEKSYVNNSQLNDLGGTLICKDGTLVLKQMGFTNDAGRILLTAIYRPERRNHLYTGVDLHFLDVNISEMLEIVPELDTVVPMLKSFAGRAECHIAGEMYMKSNYDIKYSTLRGAFAIEGKDLVLLDNETFDNISNKLMFNNKTENVIDSMDMQLTVFRKEVDLYPFLIHMDKYKAVVSGRYNLDQRYNAHIETLAPVRLALQVKNSEEDPDELAYKLVKKKYKNMYKPEKATAIQERTLYLKKLISDSLKENVDKYDTE